jgi:hypothetical protein
VSIYGRIERRVKGDGGDGARVPFGCVAPIVALGAVVGLVFAVQALSHAMGRWAPLLWIPAAVLLAGVAIDVLRARRERAPRAPKRPGLTRAQRKASRREVRERVAKPVAMRAKDQDEP